MKRILLVEDNKMNQLVAMKTLQKLGYVVVVANDGSEALDNYSGGEFDAILMDCQMPGIDGYETTLRFRERQTAIGAPPTPIIGLSARAMDTDRRDALAVGMDDYLTKPLRIDDLKTMLGRWIRTDDETTNGAVSTADADITPTPSS